MAYRTLFPYALVGLLVVVASSVAILAAVWGPGQVSLGPLPAATAEPTLSLIHI